MAIVIQFEVGKENKEVRVIGSEVEVVIVEGKKLIDYTVKELKLMCKDKGLKGYSRLKEADLIALLEE